MFLRVLKNSLKNWWKHINFSVVSSLISSINPFYIFALLYANYLLSTGFEKLREYPLPVISVFIFLFSIQSFFPSTFVMMNLEKRLIDKDFLSYKDFFKGFWKMILQSILPWLGLTIFFGTSILLVIWTGGFYFEIIANLYFKIAILIFLVFIFFVFMATQYVFFPLYFYEDYRIKVSNALKFSMEIALRNLPILSLIFIFDVIFFFGMLFVQYANFFLISILYFGFSGYVKLFLYHEIVYKYTSQKKYTTSSRYTKVGNISSPWLDLLKSKKEVIKNR